MNTEYDYILSLLPERVHVTCVDAKVHWRKPSQM